LTNFHYTQFVTDLCDSKLDGRVPGTIGHDIAREMVIQQFKELQLTPLLSSGYEQTYISTVDNLIGRNLIAVKKGIHSQGRWVLLGAHYDHLKGIPGASDNAASVGIVFETIRKLAEKNHNCDVVVAIFDMEEPPFFNNQTSMGSYIFHNHCPENLDINLLQCAVILDLVGHEMEISGKEQSLFALGVQSGAGLKQAVWSAREKLDGIQIYGSSVHVGLSDHNVFAENERPHLFLTSGRAYHYHTVEDTVDKLNFSKMERVAEFMMRLITCLDDVASASFFTEDDHAREISAFVGQPILVEQLPYWIDKIKKGLL
jgi:hypothetical protein